MDKKKSEENCLNENSDKLQERIKEFEKTGKKRNEITWGMLCDGFQSIGGIPDNFYSAEDPADRARLWSKYQREIEDEENAEIARIRRSECIYND